MLAPHPPGPDVHRGYSFPGLEKVSQVFGEEAEGKGVREKVREVRDCKVSVVLVNRDLGLGLVEAR